MTDAPNPDLDALAERFEAQRSQLRAVAYRMLGSMPEAEDVVQSAWLRISRTDTGRIDNLGAFLTTVVARLCLDALRARAARREESIELAIPDPVVSEADGTDPEQEALLADSVGLAMLIVLDTLSPPERLAFVLHDTFGLPFEQIAPIVDRTPTATRQLASRARRRVRGAHASADVPMARQRELVDAFVAASRAGDFGALVRVLDPNVVLRGDLGARGGALARTAEVRGAETVAQQALLFRAFADGARRALVNGSAGVVVFRGDRPYAVIGLAFSDQAITEIDIVADPARLDQLDLGRFAAPS